MTTQIIQVWDIFQWIGIVAFSFSSFSFLMAGELRLSMIVGGVALIVFGLKLRFFWWTPDEKESQS